MKHNNIHITGISGEKKEQGIGSLFEKMMTENLAKLVREKVTQVQKNLCTPMLIAVLFTVAKCQKQHKCPSVDEWIKKRWYIYTREHYAA